MAGESGVVVSRRSRAEIARVDGLYLTSGMGRREFCRIHGYALSMLRRHVKKQSSEQRQSGVERDRASRLVAVELASTLAPDRAA